MSLNAPEIAQQRHLKRHLTLWRFLAIICFIIGLIAISAASINNKPLSFMKQHIATIEIFGVIYRDERLLAQLKTIEESDKVSGLIVIIDSPGGTVTGSEDIYLALRKIAKNKPVTALMRGVAASGGYISAIATDQIFASGNTITGSIGVIYQWPEVVGLLDKVGVKMQTVKSSPLKAAPSPTSVLTEQERKQTQIMVKDSYDWFVELVQQRRELTFDEALKLADGRVFSGRQALKARLIDAVGDIEDAKTWVEQSLKQQDRNFKDLELIDWTPAPFDENSLTQLLKIQFNNFIGVAVFDVKNKENLAMKGLMAIMQ